MSERRHAYGDDSADEAFRILRSNLLIALSDLEYPTVIITSALPGEGKTACCANLAFSLARAGHRVVAVDLDIRHPDLHRWMAAPNEKGVTDFLLGEADITACLTYVTARYPGGSAGLYFMATGQPVQNPAELLGSSRTSRLLDGLANEADIVLLDTPPVLPVADTLVIGRIAAGAILVVEAGKTPVDASIKARDALTRSQTRILGVAVNKQRAADMTFGYGYGTTAESIVDIENDPDGPS